MVLVVEGNTARKVFREKPLEFFVVPVVGHNSMTGEDPLGIGINDKDGLIAGVKENRIRGLGSDPMDGQELSAEPPGLSPQHPLKTPTITLLEK